MTIGNVQGDASVYGAQSLLSTQSKQTREDEKTSSAPQVDTFTHQEESESAGVYTQRRNNLPLRI